MLRWARLLGMGLMLLAVVLAGPAQAAKEIGNKETTFTLGPYKIQVADALYGRQMLFITFLVDADKDQQELLKQEKNRALILNRLRGALADYTTKDLQGAAGPNLLREIMLEQVLTPLNLPSDGLAVIQMIVAPHY